MQQRVEIGMMIEQFLQARSCFVIADDGQQGSLRAERRDVARHVGCTAGSFLDTFDLEHRNRSLRRDTADVAEPVAGQHNISDHQYPCAFKFWQNYHARPPSSRFITAPRSRFIPVPQYPCKCRAKPAMGPPP